MTALILAQATSGVTQAQVALQRSVEEPTNSNPIALNLKVGEPTTLDPALSYDTETASVVEQLFIGLVDLDDETAEVRPELASSWTVSPDRMVFTFTLRSDVYWSDGHQVTAQDVRYGIQRTLAPATSASLAYPLFVIKNAEAYNSGTMANPDQVGVVALDDTHLQVTLEYPAVYALSIFSLTGARPMPRWAIDTWGDAWTEPSHIVTNGPYLLSAWVHDDHILLDKNPTYYDASNVQIEQVKMWIVDDYAAWTMYLNGQLDTAKVPLGTSLDPVLSQEVHSQPIACTYYYGFSINQPPFDNPLVRKAFIAATDRRGLINSVLDGVQQPALTFTPPGVFGYVDGYVEGVGIPYNPVRAKDWLAQAGYPNGQGLPPITLWINTNSGHQAIAEYIQQSWYTTLGISVTLKSVPWSDYQTQVNTGQFQVWRLGWCMDYPDANNFLSEGVVTERGAFGGWSNPTYEGLLGQAGVETDAEARKALYKQAEEILVDTDAVMLPLYFYNSVIATKPYLERTYPTSQFDIANWRIALTSSVASPQAGGSLSSYHGDTIIQLPPGVITDSVVLKHAPATGMPPTSSLTGIDNVFEVTAVYSDTKQPVQLVAGGTYTMTVKYADAQQGTAIENTLALYYWDSSQWVKEPSSVVNTEANSITATPSHFSLWAVFGETRRIYVPMLTIGY
jgi:oligopeptide transport system substrate-binding protein